MKKSIINYLLTFAFLALYTSSYAGGPPAIYPSTSNSNGMTPQETLEISGKLKLTNVSSAQHPQDKMIVIGPDNVLKKRPIPPISVKPGGGGPPSIGSWLVNGGSTVWTNRKVGIGTNSPSEDLEVVGNGIITGHLKIGAASMILGTFTGLSTDENHIYVEESSTQPMDLFIQSPTSSVSNPPTTGFFNHTILNANDNTGNVGIGTTNPQGKLDIQGQGDGSSLLRLSTERPWEFRQTGTGSASMLDLRAISDWKSFQITSPNGTRAAQFMVRNATDASQVYLVPDGGRVGVGTVTPSAKLEVAGDNTKNLMYLNNNTNNLPVLNGNLSYSNLRIGAPYIISFHDGANGSYIAGPNYQGGQRNFGVVGAQGLDFGGWSSNNYQSWMVIRGDGSVGIGTTTPSRLLHLQAAGNPAIRIEDEDDTRPGLLEVDNSVFTIWMAGANTNLGDIRFKTGSGGGLEKMRIKGDGKVGIGTANPEAFLHVVPTGGEEAIIIGDGPFESNRKNSLTFTEPNTGAGDNGIRWLNGSGNLWSAITGSAFGSNNLALYSSGAITFTTNNGGAERMRINSGGSVQIGMLGSINQGNAKLMVKGTSSTLDGANNFIFVAQSRGGLEELAIVHDEPSNVWRFRATTNSIPIAFNMTDSEVMRIQSQGNGKHNVGIGTDSPNVDYMLDVCGAIRATRLRVETFSCDFVFEEDYDLRSIAEVEEYIEEFGHLPDVPPASEVDENGIDVGDFQSRLLQKIEELTLYIIAQDKRMEELENQLVK